MDNKVIPSSSSDDSSDDSDQATTTATARARDEAQADSPYRGGYLEGLLRRLRITEYRPVGLLEGLERRLQVQIVAQQVMHVCQLVALVVVVHVFLRVVQRRGPGEGGD